MKDLNYFINEGYDKELSKLETSALIDIANDMFSEEDAFYIKDMSRNEIIDCIDIKFKEDKLSKKDFKDTIYVYEDEENNIEIEVELDIPDEDDLEDDDDELNEKKIRHTKKMKNSAKVVRETTEELFGKEGTARPLADKVFKIFKKELRRKSKEMNVPLGNVRSWKIVLRDYDEVKVNTNINGKKQVD